MRLALLRRFRLGLLAGFWAGWATVVADSSVLPVPAGVHFPLRAVFHAGHDAHWSEPNWDEAGWRPVVLGRSWQDQDLGLPWRVGHEGWYRIWFTMPADLADRSWIVSAGFVGNLSGLWLNGERIGGVGSFELPEITGQRWVHAAVVPPRLLHPGTNLLAVRVLNVNGAGGILGGPVGVFEAGEFLPVWKHLELEREATRVGLAALCFGWAGVPLLFRLVGDRTRMFAGTGVPVALIGLSVLLHTQLVNSLELGAARPVLALFAWLAGGCTPPAIYGFAKRLGRPTRFWAAWVATGAVLFFTLSYLHARDMGKVMGIYAAYAAWTQVAIVRQCLAAPSARQLIARATLLGTLVLTAGGAGLAAGCIWPLAPFAAQWWDVSDASILIFLLLLGGALLRGYVLAGQQETQLGQRLVSAHSDERQKLGRQVHDGVLQDVQHWRLQAELGSTETAPGAAQASLNAIGQGLVGTVRELRELAEDLQPLTRRNRTLAEALDELAQRLQQRHGLEINASVQLRDDVPPAVRETLYRIAQEAAGNACRHSCADRVDIVVRDDGETVALEVADRGQGFEPAQVPAGHFGLRFLRDHAEWIGGLLSVQAAPGRGTVIRATVTRPFRIA